MNRKTKEHIALLLVVSLLAALMMSACQPGGAESLSVDILLPSTEKELPVEADDVDENELFLEFTHQVFLDEITANVLDLHYTLAYPENYSISDYPLTFGNLGEQYRKDDLQVLQDRRDKMLSFNYDELDEGNKNTYDVFMWFLETELASEDFGYYDEYLGPTTGVQAQMPVLLAEYAFRTERDVTDYLELITDLDGYYGKILAYEQEKSEAGLFMADGTLDAILAQCRDLISETEDHFLIATFDNRVDALDFLAEEQKSEYKAANIAALDEHVFPAYQLLIDGLEELRGTGENEQGLCHFPKGKEYYSYLVKVTTGSEKTVPEMIQMTVSVMSTLRIEMQGLLQENPDLLADYEAALASLEKTDPEAMVEQLRRVMLADYPEPPDVNYEVKYVDPSMEDHLSPAFYLSPPIDLLTENTMYFNRGSSMFDDPVYAFTTTAHEGYPGHLYQTVYRSSRGLDNIRNILYFPGYTEGYASYVENYAHHYLGIQEDVMELLRLNGLLNRSIDALIDFGIHYEGWSVEELHSFLESDFGITDINITRELYQHFLNDPGNIQKYFIGCMEVMELREKAEAERGAGFSLIEFHDEFLSFGNAPFGVLEKHILGG